MNENENYKIISNEYADLLVEYNGNLNDFQRNDLSYNLIDDKYAVVFIPANEMNEQSVLTFGYSSIPKCYGLMTIKANEDGSFILHQLPSLNLTGKDVLIGIVDTGIVYTMPIFQYPDKTSKIISIWDQSINEEGRYPEGFYYGTEYHQEQINEALSSSNPLSIVPSTDTIGEGTAMAGIAAAFYDKQQKFAGESIDAELVIVKLKPAKPNLKEFFGIPDEAVCYQENDIIMGVQYLLEAANRLNRPIVICTGTGSSQGSHTGNEIINKYLYRIGELTGKAVVVPAGNEGNQNHHYYGEITALTYSSLIELNIGPQDENFTMELWAYPSDFLIIDVFAPSGEQIDQIDVSYIESGSFEINYASAKIDVDYVLSEPYSKYQLFLFRFKNIQSGLWKFQVSTKNQLSGYFHAWLPIRNFISQETYFNDANAETTICQPGNGLGVITVTSYNSFERIPDPSASRGFNLLNMPKPDISAYGINILAHSLNTSIIPFSGTSIAAAHTAGVAAQYLEWGIIKGYLPDINGIMIKYMMADSANRTVGVTYPNADWGFGLIYGD